MEVTWRMARGTRIVFADGWWVRLEQAAGGGTPIAFMRRPFDDAQAVIHLRREQPGWPLGLPDPLGLFGNQEAWSARFVVPPGADAQGPLQVRVGRRGSFPGFTLPVPPP